MVLGLAATLAGLGLLLWSADRFVEGAALTARHFRISPLLIGIVIVGFGTSAPEMVISAIAALQGNPGIALGNAYGSNITNIALVLGLAAIIAPIVIDSRIVYRELPLLLAATALAAVQIRDGVISRLDAAMLLAGFATLMAWSIWQGISNRRDALGGEMKQELDARIRPVAVALLWLMTGLAVLIASSRLLVWGAVEIAHAFNVSDLLIGLTIVALGTSLPELASTLVAARKKEPDIAVGNLIGSNLFNTLTVVGIAGAIQPMQVPAEVLSRDMLVMFLLTLMLLGICYGARNGGGINRYHGAMFVACYVAYMVFILFA